MKKLTWLILTVLLYLTSTTLNAQTKIREGKLTMVSISPTPASGKAAQVTAMLPTEQTIYFKNGYMRTEAKGRMGTIIIIKNAKTGESVSCMDMLGKKIAMKRGKESLGKMKNMISLEKPTINLRAETKMIAGIKCKRATVTYKETSASFDVWYTNDLALSNPSESIIEGIDGFMMEYKTFANGLSVSSTCTSFENISISDSLFVIPNGYELMNMDSLMNKGNGQH